MHDLLSPELCEDDFELWVEHWNRQADSQANVTNWGRPKDFIAFHNAAQGLHDDRVHCMRQLRTVFLRIAAVTGDERLSKPKQRQKMLKLKIHNRSGLLEPLTFMIACQSTGGLFCKVMFR